MVREKKSNTIDVKLYHQSRPVDTVHGPINYEVRKAAFWKSFGKDDGIEKIDDNDIARKLGDSLTRNIKNHFLKEYDGVQKTIARIYGSSLDTRSNSNNDTATQSVQDYEKFIHEAERKVLLSESIAFSVKFIAYSSIRFGLSISDICKAAELFNNNFEYFEVILEDYLIDSFVEAAGIEDASALQVSTSIPTRINDIFSDQYHNMRRNSTASPDNTGFIPSKYQKANFAWNVANRTLLVPAIIATILVVSLPTYVVTLVHETHKQEMLATQKLFDAYQQIIEEDRQRMKFYYDLYSECTKNKTLLTKKISINRYRIVRSCDCAQSCH